MPLSRNSAITVSLFAFLWAWSDFVFASTLDRNGDLTPITLSIYKYIGNNTTTGIRSWRPRSSRPFQPRCCS